MDNSDLELYSLYPHLSKKISKLSNQIRWTTFDTFLLYHLNVKEAMMRKVETSTTKYRQRIRHITLIYLSNKRPYQRFAMFSLRLECHPAFGPKEHNFDAVL